MSEMEALRSALSGRARCFEASAGASVGSEGVSRWSLGLSRDEQLGFWRESSAAQMAMGLYRLCAEEGSGEQSEPSDVWQWRLMGFLRRHCEALCALREEAGARLNAARLLASLDFERVLELAQGAPEPSAAGLRKYVSEINGSRPCSEARGRPQAALAHEKLTMALAERLGHVARFERAAVAAGRQGLPVSVGELRSWVEAAELERGCLSARASKGGSEGKRSAL